MNSTSREISAREYISLPAPSRLRGMGRARKNPRPVPTARAQGLSADYLRLLERLGVDEAHVLRQAQLKGLRLAQPTLSRLRTAALEHGTGEKNLRVIAKALDVSPEVAFPSVFTTGDAVRDRINILLAKLPAAELADVLGQVERLVARSLPIVRTDDLSSGLLDSDEQEPAPVAPRAGTKRVAKRH